MTRPSSCRVKKDELFSVMNRKNIPSLKTLCENAGVSQDLIGNAIRKTNGIVSGKSALKITKYLDVPFEAVFERVFADNATGSIQEWSISNETVDTDVCECSQEVEKKPQCIYKHSFPDGKVYIGKTVSGETTKRWNNGLGYKSQQKVFRAIVTFGWGNISHEILEDNIPYDNVAERERYYIILHDSVRNGYNATGDAPFAVPTRKELAKYESKLMMLGYDSFTEFFDDFFSSLDGEIEKGECT